MPPAFDPYRQWLGIDPADQPPDHYRLLGLRPFEADPDTIELAADRQMLHVQTFRNDPQAALAKSLLNELAAARECLLAPASKAAYDANLRTTLATRTATSKTVAAAVGASSVEPRPRATLAVCAAAVGLFALGAWLTWSSRLTAPQLPEIAHQSLVEGQTLSIHLAPANSAQFRDHLVFEVLAGSPLGVQVNRDTGALIWTPEESQGPGVYTIFARASVAGSPHLHDEASFEVQVAEAHQAPLLEPIVLRSEGRGALSAVVRGHDLDLPSGGLKYSFEITPAPAAATTAMLSEGQFFWQLAPEDLGKSLAITFRVAKTDAPDYWSEQVVRTPMIGAPTK